VTTEIRFRSVIRKQLCPYQVISNGFFTSLFIELMEKPNTYSVTNHSLKWGFSQDTGLHLRRLDMDVRIGK
jgi:hypothetical protein